MVDVKTCLDNAQEKMDMAIMYLEEALAHIRAGKSECTLIRWYPRRFLRKYGTYQQCSSNYYSGRPQYRNQALG